MSGGRVTWARFAGWTAGVVALLNLLVFAGGGLAGWPRWPWLLMAAGWALTACGNLWLTGRLRRGDPPRR